MRRLAVALALLLCWPVLVSCTDDDPGSQPADPTSSATIEPTPTESDSAGVREPSIPEGVAGGGEAAVRLFLRYYFELVTYAMQTGDTSALRAASVSCRACESTIERIEHIYSSGGRVETSGWSLRWIREDTSYRSPNHRFITRIHQGGQVLFGDDGGIVDRDPPMAFGLRITLTRPDQSWNVARLEVVK